MEMEYINVLEQYQGEIETNYTLSNGLNITITFSKSSKTRRHFYIMELSHNRYCDSCGGIDYIYGGGLSNSDISRCITDMRMLLESLENGTKVFMNRTIMDKKEYDAKIALNMLLNKNKMDKCWICLDYCLPEENIRNITNSEQSCGHVVHSSCFRLYQQKMDINEDDVKCGICKTEIGSFCCCAE